MPLAATAAPDAAKNRRRVTSFFFILLSPFCLETVWESILYRVGHAPALAIICESPITLAKPGAGYLPRQAFFSAIAP